MSHTGQVVEIIKSFDSGGLLSRLRRHGPKIPRPKKNEDLYLVHDLGDEEPRLERISPGTTGPGVLPPNSSLARLRTDDQSLNCVFAALVADKAGHAWDLVLTGAWSILESRRFLREHALKAMSVGASMSGEGMHAFFTQTLKSRVADAVAKHSIEDLRDRDALPLRWWADHLTQWLEPYGVAVKLRAAQWESADAHRAEIEQRRAAEAVRQQEQRTQQQATELRETEERNRYHAERARLDADHQMSEAERRHQLHMLEQRHRGEVLAASIAAEQSRWSHEQAALEHELKLAQLRADLDAVRIAEQQGTAAQVVHQQRMNQYAHAQQVQQAFGAMDSELVTGLAAADAMTAHQTAERLTSPEFNIPAEALEAMGYTVSPQSFISRFRQAQAATRHTVTLAMKQLQTRDIGVNPVRVDALPIGSSLQFELSSTLAGYVTLINIGTSGKVWLQVPNPYVDPASARIEANQMHTVPGPQLLPDHCIPGYFENGPAGWEHIAVTVTDTPIVDPRYLALASPSAPFIDLTSDEAAELAASLEDPPVGEYAVGLLSFLVS
jgi:hypothetical protein